MPAENRQADVTEDQAGEALQQLTLREGGSDSGIPASETKEQPAEETLPAGTEKESTEPTEVLSTEGEQLTDDVESLKQRAEQLESKAKESEKHFQQRLHALQQRYEENERILRERYLRKSTATDNALKILRTARSEEGVAEADVDRVIREMEGTMNPASASYVPPDTTTGTVATEDQALVLNNFLSEKLMTGDEAEEFGKWIQTEANQVMSPAEQAVANQSLDGFLRLAHTRWQEGIHEKDREAKRNDAVGAVKSVQRTQREAAKAAEMSTTAPKKQPAGPKAETDVSKLTKEDISTLLRQSMQQYR